jgi:hypothetical protein
LHTDEPNQNQTIKSPEPKPEIKPLAIPDAG